MKLQRLIRIGLALLMSCVLVAPALAKAVECCCGPGAPKKAKSCCSDCKCELRKAAEVEQTPLALPTLVDLEPGLLPIFPAQAIAPSLLPPQIWPPEPEPLCHSPPDRLQPRAPPLFCS